MSQIYNESGRTSLEDASGFYVKYKQDALIFGTLVGVEREYFVKKNLTNTQKEQVALAIFQEVSYEFENYQSMAALISSSSFEPADLVSDLLHFYNCFRPSTCSETDILNLCSEMSMNNSLLVYKAYPGTFEKSQYKNYTFLPKFFQTNLCSNPLFPSLFNTITPAVKGQLFRIWSIFDN